MAAPGCSGRIYRCPDCPDLPAMTIGESFDHLNAQHPEKVTRKSEIRQKSNGQAIAHTVTRNAD